MSDQEENSKSFANENVTVKVTRGPRCKVKFDINVTPLAIEASYQQALKNMNKEINIPGFRKGKAPVDLITEKYGSAIQKEFVDIAIQTAFNEAIHLTQIHPLKDGQIKRPVVHSCSRETGAHFVIEFESRPEIPTINPADLTIRKIVPASINEEQRNEALHRVKLQFTTYEPVNDRGVKENDFVDLDITILEDPPQQIVKNQRIEINSKNVPHWIRPKLIGLKANESAEGVTEPDLNDPNPQFKPAPFRVQVNAIWKGVPPAEDDDLAKKVGLQSMEELRKKIDERLEQDVANEAYHLQVAELENALLGKYSFELPQTYLDGDKKARLDHYVQQLTQQNRAEEARQNYREIEKFIEASSHRGLLLYFLLHKVAADNKIELKGEDVTQELNRQLSLVPSGKSQIDLNAGKEQMREQIYNIALDRKTKQFLLDNVTLT